MPDNMSTHYKVEIILSTHIEDGIVHGSEVEDIWEIIFKSEDAARDLYTKIVDRERGRMSKG